MAISTDASGVLRRYSFPAMSIAARKIGADGTESTAPSGLISDEVLTQTMMDLNDRISAALSDGLEDTLAKINDCCCEQKMLVAETGAGINANIAQSRYDAAMNTAAINANTTMQTQRILDAMAQDKIEALQNRVNSLELQAAVSNVVKYPNSFVYSSACNPFCHCDTTTTTTTG